MTDDFLLLPAIDLREGKVVRLAQGDPTRQTIYGDDPRAWAERWKAEGAEWLHVVNLSGAFGEQADANWKALERILSVGLNVEFGGGLREKESIRAALDLGVTRVCLGTAAIQNPPLLAWALETYGPQRIAGDLGARDGRVTISGWQEVTALTVLEAGQFLYAQGVRWCVLTDVRRDGVGSGLNVGGAAALQAATGLRVIASGGVSSLEDIRRARAAGLAGVIVGRALYEGKLSLRECFHDDYPR